MTRYMVIVLTDNGEQTARFFDDAGAAEKYRQDAECGLGWYAEVYERKEDEDGVRQYMFIYA